MRGKNIESLTNELVKATRDKTSLLNKAIKLITDEFEKHDEVTIEQLEVGHLLVKGRTYGQAIVDLNEEFKNIKTTYSAEVIAREIMEIILKELLGDSDHVL